MTARTGKGEWDTLARRVLAPRWRRACAGVGADVRTPREALEGAAARGLLPAGWREGAVRRWFVHPKVRLGEPVTPLSEVMVQPETVAEAQIALKLTFIGAIFGGLVGACADHAARRPVRAETVARGAVAGAAFLAASERALAREPHTAEAVRTLAALGDAFGQAEELARSFSLRTGETTARGVPEVAWHVCPAGHLDRWRGLDRGPLGEDPLSRAVDRLRASVRPELYEQATALAALHALPWEPSSDPTPLGRAAVALREDYLYRRLAALVAEEKPAGDASDLPVAYRAEQRPPAALPPNVFEPLVGLWRLGVAIGSWTPDLVTLVCPPWDGGRAR